MSEFTNKELKEIYIISLQKGIFFRKIIVDILYDSYKKEKNKYKRFYIGAEIFSKLIMQIEDIGQFFLIQEHGSEKYLNHQSREIKKFFNQILNNKVYIEKIFNCLKLNSNKHWKYIKDIKTRKKYKSEYEKILNTEKKQLINLANCWVKDNRKSNSVNIAEYLKHGYHIIFPEDLPEKYRTKILNKAQVIYFYNKKINQFVSSSDDFSDQKLIEKVVKTVHSAVDFFYVINKIALLKYGEKKEVIYFIDNLYNKFLVK